MAHPLLSLSTLLVFLLSSACSSSSSSSSLVSDLRVEFLVAPINVDNEAPRFSWVVDHSITQTLYQMVVVATSDATTVYDTGVVSSTTNVIIYGAQPNTTALPLQSDTDYTWYLGVYSSAANGEWINATASFSMGLLSPRDWKGVWIGGSKEMRTNFTLLPTSSSTTNKSTTTATNAISRARLYITAVGCYTLYVNGVEVSQGGLNMSEPASFANPGFSTIYTSRVLYNSYDVSSLLSVATENVVALRLGACKYGYLGEFCPFDDITCNRAIVQLNVQISSSFSTTTTSSSSISITSNTNTTWVGCTTSPLLNAHFYNGETYNASLEQPGWNAPGFQPPSSFAWIPVIELPSPTYQLSSHAMPQITAYETLTPATVTQIGGKTSNSYVFDLLKNGAGRCTLMIPGPVPANAQITTTFGEMLNANGSVHVQFACPSSCCADGGNCANQTFHYVTRGGGTEDESTTPIFAYSGFRYIQVDGWVSSTSTPPTVDLLSCSITSTNVEVAGNVTFNSSTGFILNSIQSAIIRSQRSNLHSIPTDCAQREKRGWLADSHVSASEASLNLFMIHVYSNWLRTFADSVQIGCVNLTSNWTCPKWHSDQPGSGAGRNELMMTSYDDEDMIRVYYNNEMGRLPTLTDEIDTYNLDEQQQNSGPSVGNCYICCYGRPGFGCQPNMPTITTGAIGDVIPFDKNGYGSVPGSICWTSAFFVISEIMIDRYADVQTIESLYPALQTHFAYYHDTAQAQNPTTGLIPYETYGDWNELVNTNHLFFANAYYFNDALILAKAATLIGNTNDAAAYLALAATISDASVTAFLNISSSSGSAVWDGGQQGPQSIGLFMQLGGAAVTKYRQDMLAALTADIAARNTHVTVGTLGTRHILQALSILGAGDVALALANQTSMPSWGFFVTSGPVARSASSSSSSSESDKVVEEDNEGNETPLIETVTSESAVLGTLWESWTGGGASYNHIMFGGGIGNWFYEYALGLQHKYKLASPVTTPGEREEEEEKGKEPEGIEEDCVAVLSGLPKSVLNGFSKELQQQQQQQREGKKVFLCAVADIVKTIKRGMQKTAMGNLNGFDPSHHPLTFADVRRIASKALTERRRRRSTTKHTTHSPKRKPELVSTARLLLDEAIVRNLHSASGHIRTLSGVLSASWLYTTSRGSGGGRRDGGGLHVSLQVPSSTETSIFIPVSLLREFGVSSGVNNGEEKRVLQLKKHDYEGATVTRIEINDILIQTSAASPPPPTPTTHTTPTTWKIVTAIEAYEHDLAGEKRLFVRFDGITPGEWTLSV